VVVTSAIRGRVIGYLSRDDAAVYVPSLRRLTEAGRVTAVHAELRRGWDRGVGHRGSFGVVLFLGTVHEVEVQVEVALR